MPEAFEMPDHEVTLETILARLRPRRIIQTSLESAEEMQIAVKIARDLQQRASYDCVFYAVAANPESYLGAVRVLREGNLLPFAQVLLGLPLTRHVLHSCAVDVPIAGNAPDARLPDVVHGWPSAAMLEHLPEGLLRGCVEDLAWAPDLVVTGTNPSVTAAEIGEVLRLSKAPSHILLRSAGALAKEPRDGLGKDSGLIREAECVDPEGVLVKTAGSHLNGRSRTTRRGELCRPGPRRMRIAIVLIEHMGDIVACEPVSRHIRKMYPGAHITWVVREPYRELVEENPFIDEVLVVGCLTEWSLISKSGVYDEIIDLHINKRECPHCGMPANRWTTRRDVTLDNYYHYGPLLSVFASCAGLPRLNDAPRLYIPDSVRASIDALSLPDDFVVFHTSSNESSRDWPEEKWQELCTSLTGVWSGEIVEIGHKASLAGGPLGRINLCNRLSILESAEVIRRARLFVGIDSGPAHLANAVGTQGIVLLGQYRTFERYTPYTGSYAGNTGATLLRAARGPAKNLTVSRVLGAVLRRLKRPGIPKAVLPAAKPGCRSGSGSGTQVRLIAFYLPQYHPIPENDRWWGTGFTEWRNVSRAQPLYEGHYQPHLPGQLGFYDLRLQGVLEQQAAMARAAGIEGFCFWHYWFNGKLLLEQPVVRMLESGTPDFPFCFAWANENWTRRWDGQESEVLISQSYGGTGDDRNHFEWLVRAFRDHRYMKVDGRPLLAIYRPLDLPDAPATVQLWSRLAAENGLPRPFLVAIHTNFDNGDFLRASGFDAELIFQPNSRGSYQRIQRLNLERHSLFPLLYSEEIRAAREKGATVCDYDDAWPIFASAAASLPSAYPCVVPSWDNTSRRANYGAFVLGHATPASYERWLRWEIARSRNRPADQRIVFINAWNEWAEGNHLEPDLRFGLAYLEATRRALERAGSEAEDASEALDRAKELSRIQPLIKRLVHTIHKRSDWRPLADGSALETSILPRLKEIVVSASRLPGREQRMNHVMTEAVRELLKAWDSEALLTRIYNCASGLAEDGGKEEAKLLFSFVAEATEPHFRELCGKSHYKLALLSQHRSETVRHLSRCVRLYPEHRAATKFLQEYKPRSVAGRAGLLRRRTRRRATGVSRSGQQTS